MLKLTAAVLVMSVSFLAPGAFAEDMNNIRLYLGGDIGYSSMNLDSGGFNTVGSFPNTRSDSDVIYPYSVQIGAKYKNWRFDFGASRLTNDAKFVTASFMPPTPTFFYSSKVDVNSYLFSAYFTPFVHQKFGAYLGGGAGYSTIDVNVTDSVVFGDDSVGEFTWKAEGGFEYYLTDSITWSIGYRYIDMGKADIPLTDLASSPAGNFTASLSAHEGFVGLKYFFR